MKKRLPLLLLLSIIALVPIFTVGATSAFAQGDTHTVTFMLDADSVYQTDQVEDGGYARIPRTPLKNGSYFLYWETQDQTKFKFYEPITQDVTLYAKWKDVEKFYTVEFYANDKLVSKQEIKENANAHAPVNVHVSNGKILSGWQDQNGAIVTDFTNVTANAKYYAIFTDKTYTVQFIGFNGTIVNSLTQTVKHGEDLKLTDFASQVPEIPHYTYGGLEGVTENIVKNEIVKIKYTPLKYDVNFYVEGVQFGQTQSFDYGTPVAFPKEIPSKENYIFTGWYLDGEQVMYNFSAPISENLDLYARFIPIALPKYNVTFYNYNNEQYGGVQTVEEGKSAIEPGNPYREGYTFIKWDCDFSSVTEDITVHPIYKINEYTLTVNYFEGQQPQIYKVPFGGSVAEPKADQVPVPEGYEFIGFDASFKNIKQDTVINARYKKLTFAVMFYNGSTKIGVTQYVEYGEDAVAPVLAQKEGYTFIGWALGENVGLDVYKNIKDVSVFFAVYEQNKYTVTFMEGQTVKETLTDVLYGERIHLYSYDKEGYIFIGWYTSAECSENSKYDFNSKVVENLTLYAKWEEKPDVVYTVTFMVDNLQYGEIQQVMEGANAILPANPSKEGYTFIGWDVSVDNVRANVVANALFEINKYTVTFVYGEGLKTVIKDVEYLTDLTDRAPTALEKVGYTFTGWDKDFSKITSDITVNAVYTIKTYQVKFYNGSEVVADRIVKHGEYVTMISNPSQMGKEFDRWTSDIEGKEEFSFSNPITQDTNVYAQFIANKYSIQYYVEGKIYKTETYEFGQKIVPIDAPVLDDATKVFIGWGEIPETMPANTVVVMAEIYTKHYYEIAYYVNGQLDYTASVLEGEQISEYVPENLPEDIVFNGWINVPDVMPTYNIKIDADIEILEYFEISYYIDGQLYTTIKVLEGRDIPEMGSPTELPQDVVFISWGNIPAKMPSDDVSVDAVIKKYYSLKYYINGELYCLEKVLEGDRISVVGAPELESGLEFVGWNLDYDIMPDFDLEVHAIINVVELVDNKFEIITSRNENGGLTVQIQVSGNVNLAGVLATVAFSGDVRVIGTSTDVGLCEVNAEKNILKFVWSNADSVKEKTVLLTVELESGAGSVLSLNILDIYALDAQGNLIVPEYNSEIK